MKKNEKIIEKASADAAEKKAEAKKKAEHGLTDEQVEEEIARLNASPYVVLARHEQRLRYRRRQYLYQLRDYEKKGKALMDAGLTREVLDELYRNYADESVSVLRQICGKDE